MLPYFGDKFGNPSSMHSFGLIVEKDIEKAREKIADLLKASSTEIIFTSCGTESDNTAILGALNAIQLPNKKHFITTKVEHPAVISTARELNRIGYRITYMHVDRLGRLDLDELRDAITPETALVSIMWANNETGVIFPIEEISQITRAAGVLLHVDAVQAVGKIPVDMKKIPVDMLSISGHKLHAPKGIGVLYVRRGTRIRPYIHGGHQERGRRAGTENVPYIAGLGVAAELAKENIKKERNEVARLRDKLEQGILKTVPKVLINGDPENRLPNTSSLSFELVEGEAILLKLDQYGIAASSGSACSSGSLEPSHVLRAMGVPFTASHGSIRFSLSRYTTEKEIDYTLEHVPAIISELRSISPFWRDYEKGLAVNK
jgi:cysteine desulfurase